MKYDVLSLGVRKQFLDEILQEENQRRKEESIRRYEIYKQNQKRFVLQALVNEFSPKTVVSMRTLTSINLTKRIIDQKHLSIAMHLLERFHDSVGQASQIQK